MTILPNTEEAMEDARNGKLSPYWQNDLKRECLHRKLSAEERQALSELNRILSETPQWSGEEELCIEMENIGGMTIYKDTELKAYLEQADFHEVQIHKKKGWLCVSAQK